MQFFIRQLVYSNAASIPKELKNVVSLIGPLHISLYARECVLLNFHQVFADLYSFLFGRKTKLAMKPETLAHISVVGSYLYVWSMGTSKGHDYVSLLQVQGCPVSNTCEFPRQLYLFGAEHLFNYLQMQQIRSFFKSLLNIWVMFVVFRRRHYNKALLIMLSTFLHWQGNAPSMFETMREHLAAFDEYPVENFPSVLRRRIKETDTADEIAAKGKRN